MIMLSAGCQASQAYTMAFTVRFGCLLLAFFGCCFAKFLVHELSLVQAVVKSKI